MTIEPLMMGTVYLAGLISFFSPCIFPVLPVYLSILMQGGKRSVSRTLLFVLGLFLTFFVIGIGAGLVGQVLASMPARILGAIFILLFGIYQAGWIQIPFLERSKLFGRSWQRDSEWAPFFIGVTFSLGWTPCVGPVLASILVVASTTGTITASLLTMLSYMLGIATPFVVLAFASQSLMDRLQVVKKHLQTIQKWGGILLVCVGIFLLGQQFYEWRPEQPAAVQSLVDKQQAKAENAESSLQGIVLEDVQGRPYDLNQLQGKPVYIKLWASWCHVCLRGLPEIESMSEHPNPNYQVITVVFPGQFGEKDAQAFRTWYAKQGYLHMVVLMDTNGVLARKFRPRAFPTNVFVNKDLQIKQIIPGHMSPDTIQFVFDL